MRIQILFTSLFIAGCFGAIAPVPEWNDNGVEQSQIITGKPSYEKGSWPYFLQHLPLRKGTILDFEGDPVPDQEKHVWIVDIDVGNRDLQQCADAIMRLRAEYLFSEKRYTEIGFHFTSGHYYSWTDYCKGKRPVISGNKLKFVQKGASSNDHASLRKYLDIVYTYAGTISLEKELKPADAFEIGTVIITPGSPGHCCIIVDEITLNGVKHFQLAEGYTPAQSIYILRNPQQDGISPWYALKKGVIETASYRFTNYRLKKFE
jgi:hypothetical protein